MAKPVISLLSDDEKENAVVHDNEMPQENSKLEQRSPSEAPRKDVPSTPASRLALPDLIGMGDVRRPVQNISPDERIEWDHDKDMTHSSTSSFGGIRRAKKRARSSSPTTSSPARAFAYFNVKDESINPQADPGSELWGRYSLNGSNMPTPQGGSIPALAHIMNTSSPQPSKDGATPRSVAGFSRANSCGNQFPKRRRVGGNDDDVFTESANIGPSKLSVLIERVQEGLSQPKPPLTENGSVNCSHPSLKRPSSEIEEDPPIPTSSREGAKYIPNHLGPSEPQPGPEESEKIHPNPPQTQPRSNSSDYGDEFDDDELDATLLDSFGSKPQEFVSNISDKLTPRLPPDPPPQPYPSKAEVQSRGAKASKYSESSTVKLEDDEFDDSDEDICTADLEHIVARFDNQHPVSNEATSVTKPRMGGQVLKADSDDEFGDDDLDEHDFEEAEAKTTQSIQKTTSSLLPVRTRFR
jgi:hypothetical protein